ncbi:MAG: VTT domain-containing protein [Ruminococcus sp.]|nr:VTT domain-containing protein [Ruminococcus sp.]
MKEKTKNILLKILRYVPLLVCLILMLAYFFSGRDFSAESLQNYAPDNLFIAALFLIFLYVVKSLTIFFPIIVLNVLGGYLFNPVLALVVNFIGVLVELALPYWIGRASGAKFADKLCEKYPKIGEMLGGENGSNFFISYFLRAISCLPNDAVSMIFGARKIPFFTCLIASFLGTLPGVVAATLLGSTISDPSSPLFWIALVCTIAIALSSLLIYRIWKKKKEKRAD